MQRVFALINFGFDEDNDKFNPEAEEGTYYADCDEALNDNKIVGWVAVETTYDDDDCVFVDHTNPIFDDCHNMWPDGGPMPHEKIKWRVSTSLVAIFLATTLIIIPMPG